MKCRTNVRPPHDPPPSQCRLSAVSHLRVVRLELSAAVRDVGVTAGVDEEVQTSAVVIATSHRACAGGRAGAGPGGEGGLVSMWVGQIN